MKKYVNVEDISLTDFEIAMCHNYKELCEALLEKIEKAPATDMRPVVRGQWVKHNATHIQKGGMYLECSCCHEYTTVLGHVLAYCPNCGAEMEGKVADI